MKKFGGLTITIFRVGIILIEMETDWLPHIKQKRNTPLLRCISFFGSLCFEAYFTLVTTTSSTKRATVFTS